jgi:short-subunit dehydrogenase
VFIEFSICDVSNKLFLIALVALMRTLTAPASANGIAISLVAPGMTETPLLGTLPDIREAMNGKAADEESLQALFANLRSIGIPSQEPDTVAQAILYLIEQGDGAAGLGLLVQGGEVIDLESELQRTRPEWLTQRMEYLLRSEAPVWKK